MTAAALLLSLSMMLLLLSMFLLPKSSAAANEVASTDWILADFVATGNTAAAEIVCLSLLLTSLEIVVAYFAAVSIGVDRCNHREDSLLKTAHIAGGLIHTWQYNMQNVPRTILTTPSLLPSRTDELLRILWGEPAKPRMLLIDSLRPLTRFVKASPSCPSFSLLI